jgi:hypothetical protein
MLYSGGLLDPTLAVLILVRTQCLSCIWIPTTRWLWQSNMAEGEILYIDRLSGIGVHHCRCKHAINIQEFISIEVALGTQST